MLAILKEEEAGKGDGDAEGDSGGWEAARGGESEEGKEGELGSAGVGDGLTADRSFSVS